VDVNGAETCLESVMHPLKQRCSFNNCKDWESNDGTKAAESCKSCFDEKEVNYYDLWKGKASYSEEALMGRNDNVPFRLKDEQCLLQCDLNKDWWVDWNYWSYPKIHISNSELEDLLIDDSLYTEDWEFDDPLTIDTSKPGLEEKDFSIS